MGIDEIREVEDLANRLRTKMHGAKIAGFTVFNNPNSCGNDRWRARAWIAGETHYVHIGSDVTAAKEKILLWLTGHPQEAKMLRERQGKKK